MSALRGKMVVFTGTLGQRRADAKSAAQAAGANVAAAVSKKTDILVTGAKGALGVATAKSLGVTVWSEAQFKAALKGKPIPKDEVGAKEGEDGTCDNTKSSRGKRDRDEVDVKLPVVATRKVAVPVPDKKVIKANLTALQVAASEGNLTQVQELVRQHAGKTFSLDSVQLFKGSVDGVTHSTLNALAIASQACHTEIVDFLISEGADVNATEGEDNIPVLSYAASGGSLTIVKMLCDAGADIHASNKRNKQSTLHVAARKGHLSIVEFLLEKGANVNAVDEDGANAVAYAVSFPNVLKVLIQAGGLVNDIPNANPDIVAISPLHLAVRSSLESCKILVEAGANIHALSQGGTPLLFAAWGLQPDVVEYLISKGARCDISDQQDGRGPLHILNHYAEENGRSMDTVRLLLKSGVNVNTQDAEGKTPLFYIPCNGSKSVGIQVAEALLEAGADRTIRCNRRSATHGGGTAAQTLQSDYEPSQHGKAIADFINNF